LLVVLVVDQVVLVIQLWHFLIHLMNALFCN
jgi:hypothetical protein